MTMQELATPRHPLDTALDEYAAEAEASGDAEQIADAQRTRTIRGHRHFDPLVTVMRVHGLRFIPGYDTNAAMPTTDDPYVRARALASVIADQLRLGRGAAVDQVMWLASEYASTPRRR